MFIGPSSILWGDAGVCVASLPMSAKRLASNSPIWASALAPNLPRSESDLTLHDLGFLCYRR